MQMAAVTKAKARLTKAAAALEAIRNAESISDLEHAWTDYLLAHSSIFTILEQGAKGSPQSRQWFGAKKKIKRQDPLLEYLHQARNANEHDIPSVVERRLAGGITFGDDPAGPRRKITSVSFTPAGGKSMVIGEAEEGLSNVTLLRPVMILLRVHDSRFGTYCDPPREHMGQVLANPYPIGVAEVGLSYVTGLIAEAEAVAR